MDKRYTKADEILDFIKRYTDKQGYAPSIRDICQGVHLNSTSSVYYHLKRMKQAGLISMDSSHSRSITMTNKGQGLPIIGSVAAGYPITAVECIQGYLELDDDEEHFALSVKGDSMKNIGMLNGDYVIVRRADVAQHGQIVVAMLDEEATVKRYFFQGNTVLLMPENEDFSPINGKDAIILGIVTGLYRTF